MEGPIGTVASIKMWFAQLFLLLLSQWETSVGGPRSMHGSQEKGDGNLMT